MKKIKKVKSFLQRLWWIIPILILLLIISYFTSNGDVAEMVIKHTVIAENKDNDIQILNEKLSAVLDRNEQYSDELKIKDNDIEKLKKKKQKVIVRVIEKQIEVNDKKYIPMSEYDLVVDISYSIEKGWEAKEKIWIIKEVELIEAVEDCKLEVNNLKIVYDDLFKDFKKIAKSAKKKWALVAGIGGGITKHGTGEIHVGLTFGKIILKL